MRINLTPVRNLRFALWLAKKWGGKGLGVASISTGCGNRGAQARSAPRRRIVRTWGCRRLGDAGGGAAVPLAVVADGLCGLGRPRGTPLLL